MKMKMTSQKRKRKKSETWCQASPLKSSAVISLKLQSSNSLMSGALLSMPRSTLIS